MLSQIQYEPFAGVKGWKWHMTAGLLEHNRTVDQAGRPIRYTLGGLIRDLRYDAAGRITSYTHYGLNDGVPQRGYDQSFGYDEVGRLKQVGLSGGTTWNFDHDNNGNRKWTTLGGTTNTYTTPATSNKLASISNPLREFGYDAAGNTLTDTGKGYTATYDLAGRLRTIARSGVTTTYTYDNFGRRIRKRSSAGESGTVLFVYSQEDQLLGEYDSKGKALREYVWLGSTPVAMFTPDPANPTGNPLVYYIHADHLDTPRVVIDKNQGRRWRWLAEPFGTSAPETNPEGRGVFTQNLRFPGQYADQESGLNYNYFRNYDSSTGRYTQSDLIGLNGGINTYSYVYGNPLMYVDPNGLWGIADLPSIPQPVLDITTGVSDAASLGLGPLARQWLDVDGGVDRCSKAYSAGEWASLGLGAGRMAYAGIAKVGAAAAANGAAAMTFRDGLKRVMRGPLAGSNYRIKTYEDLMAKYGSDAAIQNAAGHTNRATNAVGADLGIGGSVGAATCGCP